MTRALLLALAVTAIAAGCGGAGGGGSPSAAGASPSTGESAGTTVEVKNFAYAPATLAASVGDAVTWRFEDAELHTATATDGQFESRALNNGQIYRFTFTKPGTYRYFCALHPAMKGKIVVK